MSEVIPLENIINKIYVFRDVKVMLDRDLADLYGVETSQLKRQVKRNINRFPEDFMFELTKEELNYWRCHFGISNSLKMGLRYTPYVFTEQEVSMLSSVLNSKRAIQVNIQIMRIFSRFRQMLSTNDELKKKIESIEKKYDGQFKIVFETIKALITDDIKPKRKIGFDNKK
jgi:hypothetical protein